MLEFNKNKILRKVSSYVKEDNHKEFNSQIMNYLQKINTVILVAFNDELDISVRIKKVVLNYVSNIVKNKKRSVSGGVFQNTAKIKY